MMRTLSVLATALAVQGCARSEPVFAPIVARMSAHADEGPRLLAATNVELRDIGDVVSAHDREGLVAMWARFQLPSAPPDVSFERDVVVGYVHADDGCIEELTGLAVDARGRLWPELATIHEVCPLPYMATAHVFTVPRSLLRDDAIELAGQRLSFPALDPLLLPRREPSEAAAVGALDRGVCRVPQRGEVDLCTLDDGAMVFVAHDDEGEVRVLATDAPDRFGLPSLIAWEPSTRRFEYTWDVRGRSVSGTERPLDTFVATRVDGSHLRVGRRTRPSEDLRLPIAPPGNATPSLRGGLSPFHGRPALPLEEAVVREGHVVVVDAGLVTVDGELPKLCPRTGGAPVCDSRARAVRGLSLHRLPPGRLAWIGPFAARVQRGEFVDLVHLSHATQLSAASGERSAEFARYARETRERAARAPVGWETSERAGLGVELAAGVTAATHADRATLAGGVGARAGVRYYPYASSVEGDFLKQAAWGDVWGLELRVNALRETARGAPGARTLAMGFALTAENAIGVDSRTARVRTGTLLGTLLPEVGFALRSDAPAAFTTAHTFPVGLLLRDDLAIELAPRASFLWQASSEGGPSVMFGLSLAAVDRLPPRRRPLRF